MGGIPEKDKRLRYDDYKISVAMAGGAKKHAKARARFKSGQNTNASGKPKHTMGSLSQCSMLYAQALMDPWAVDMPPCIPDQVVLPSYKFGAQARGTFTIGTQGVGFVAVNPYTGVWTGGGTFSVYYTGATYALQAYTSVGGTTGLGAGQSDTSLLQSSWNPDGYQFRVVGCGVKCRYMGSEISRSGRFIEYRHPNNYQIANGSTAQDLLQNRETQTAPADRKEHFVVYRPAGSQDLAYLNNDGFTPLPVTPTMVVMIEGGTPGQSFEYDVQWWFEVAGRLLPTVTKSDSDPIGLAAVKSALPKAQSKESPGSTFKSFVSDIYDVASTTFSFISPLIDAIGGVENIIPTIGALF